MYRLLVFTILLNCLISISHQTCPHTELYSPCTCKSVSDLIYIDCNQNDFSANRGLQDATRFLHDYQIYKLTLSNFHFEELNDQTFVDLTVQELYILDSYFRLTSKQRFARGLEDSLISINIQNAESILNDSIMSVNFTHLKSLTSLTIKSNLQQVKSDWSQNLPNSLTKIIINNAKVSKVEDMAFSSLLNIQNIKMQTNKVKEINRNAFPRPADSLSEIDLSHNEITELEPGFFAEMKELKKVYLYNNKLKTIDINTWGPIFERASGFIRLTNNEFYCDEKILWLEKYETNFYSIFSGEMCFGPDNKKSISQFITEAKNKRKSKERALSVHENPDDKRNSSLTPNFVLSRLMYPLRKRKDVKG